MCYNILHCHLTSPPTCQSHLTSDSADLPESPHGWLRRPARVTSRLTPPTCQSHITSDSADLPESPHVWLRRPARVTSRLTPPTCQSHLTSPLTCQSHLTSPLTCHSHPTSPLTCQSHPTSPLTCQNLVTPQQFTQCHFTSLLSLPPRPGGLRSHWLHMDLALRSLPRFHLPPGWCRVCEASGSRSLGGGALSRIWLPLTTLQLHITHGLHLPSCTALTHSHPPLHQSHSCHQSLIRLDCLTTPAPHSLTSLTSFTHPHISTTLPYTRCKVLFLPRLTFLSVHHSLWLLLLCLTPDCLTLELWTCACDLDPCLVLFTSLLYPWYSCYCPLTIASLILPLSNKYYCTWIHTPLTSLYKCIIVLLKVSCPKLYSTRAGTIWTMWLTRTSWFIDWVEKQSNTPSQDRI